jgi:hypothetical protein
MRRIFAFGITVTFVLAGCSSSSTSAPTSVSPSPPSLASSSPSPLPASKSVSHPAEAATSSFNGQPSSSPPEAVDALKLVKTLFQLVVDAGPPAICGADYEISCCSSKLQEFIADHMASNSFQFAVTPGKFCLEAYSEVYAAPGKGSMSQVVVQETDQIEIFFKANLRHNSVASCGVGFERGGKPGLMNEMTCAGPVRKGGAQDVYISSDNDSDFAFH